MNWTTQMDELTYRDRPEAFARIDGTIEIVHHFQWDDGLDTSSPTRKQAAAGIVGIIEEVYNTSEYHEVMAGETCPVAFHVISDEQRIAAAIVATKDPDDLRAVLAILTPAERSRQALSCWLIWCSDTTPIANPSLVNWDQVAEYVCQLVDFPGGRLAPTVTEEEV